MLMLHVFQRCGGVYSVDVTHVPTLWRNLLCRRYTHYNAVGEFIVLTFHVFQHFGTVYCADVTRDATLWRSFIVLALHVIPTNHM